MLTRRSGALPEFLVYAPENSPRASLCLLKCARARALLEGRPYFTHEDVQRVALGVLGHRLIVRPEAEVEGKNVKDIVRELLDSVPVLGQ